MGYLPVSITAENKVHRWQQTVHPDCACRVNVEVLERVRRLQSTDATGAILIAWAIEKVEKLSTNSEMPLIRLRSVIWKASLER
jgi:hypothetical protein